MTEKNSYIYYGTSTTSSEIKKFMSHIIDVNKKNIKENKNRIPICIWGKHGVGKTHIVEEIAKEKGYDFTYIAPAQFEEMGDLIGMPKIIGDKTKFLAPDWVPTEDKPGILLIDDVNRADDRILRGIMQLLQNYELVSWKLPKQRNIILTANPDGGDYSVTPMDDAMITRMMHITFQFDVNQWALWAEKNRVDSRGINFVLTYPEIVTGERTTPRTLVQFFDSISHILNLEDEIPLIQLLADSTLDQSTSTAFISFINNNLSKLITPEEIIYAKDFKKEVYNTLKPIIKKEIIRIDILATLCTRIVNYFILNNIKLDKKGISNIKNFILIDFLPNDLRFVLAQDIIQSKNSNLKILLADKDIGQLLLKKM